MARAYTNLEISCSRIRLPAGVNLGPGRYADRVQPMNAVTHRPEGTSAYPKEFFDNRFVKELQESGLLNFIADDTA